jgi:GAF domain-containing protein
LQSIKFHLDNPLSKGTAVQVFKKQKPILINDVNEIEKDLSPRSIDFVRAMGSQSFICVPIVYKGESMGVMIVDNVQSKHPLDQTEMNLLMGIAPQIGISINNAMAYQKIKESEARFRALSENAPDIIYTLGNNGEFTYVNPAIEAILGYRPEEVIGKRNMLRASSKSRIKSKPLKKMEASFFTKTVRNGTSVSVARQILIQKAM